MRCRFNWGIYWKKPDGSRQLMRNYWSSPMWCNDRPPEEDGICLEEITSA
jgi:hypothetical protein